MEITSGDYNNPGHLVQISVRHPFPEAGGAVFATPRIACRGQQWQAGHGR
jgi:hypothetical protein